MHEHVRAVCGKPVWRAPLSCTAHRAQVAAPLAELLRFVYAKATRAIKATSSRFTSLDSDVRAPVQNLGVNEGRQRTRGRQQDDRTYEADDERSEGHERDRTRPLVR